MFITVYYYILNGALFTVLLAADNAQGPEPFKSSAYDCLLSIGNGDQ